MSSTLPRVELIAFDLDGTLVDSSRDLAAAVGAALERLAPGTPPLPLEKVLSFVGNGAARLVERSLRAAGLDALGATEVLPVFLTCYRERLLDTTRLYPGAEAALDRLAHLPLAVLSNKPGDLSRELVAGLGLSDRFRRVIGAGDVPEKKPHPGGLRTLLRELDAAVERSLMVGDSGVDILTGRAAGVATVGLRGGFDPIGVASAGPDLLLDDLSELPDRLGELLLTS